MLLAQHIKEHHLTTPQKTLHLNPSQDVGEFPTQVVAHFCPHTKHKSLHLFPWCFLERKSMYYRRVSSCYN